MSGRVPARPLLVPFMPVYGAGLWLKHRFVESRRGYVRSLRYPVISVGSLSAGGAGKTPVVEALAALLQCKGYAVDVLSRGYGRRGKLLERVDALGTAERFGDEPLVLARGSGVPVYVGRDRYRTGLIAEREFRGNGTLIHLLDDGFQHRRLARALDVVLLTRREVGDWLLPAGNLREPLTRLSRAGAIVVRDDEEEALRSVVARFARGGTPVWVIQRLLEVPPGKSGRPLAFCGIARPDNFFSMLRAEGVQPAGAVAFGDHRRYTARDVGRLVEATRRTWADGFVTTEKDAVKLTPAMLERLQAIGPVTVARLRVRFVNEAAVGVRLRHVVRESG